MHHEKYYVVFWSHCWSRLAPWRRTTFAPPPISARLPFPTRLGTIRTGLLNGSAPSPISERSDWVCFWCSHVNKTYVTISCFNLLLYAKMMGGPLDFTVRLRLAW